MHREWIYFEFETILREFRSLPANDYGKLMALMEHYRITGSGNPAPVRIDEYGGGLIRLRHVKSSYHGRLLFFVAERRAEYEKLVVLTVFKKEGRDVPRNVLERARARMTDYRRANPKNG